MLASMVGGTNEAKLVLVMCLGEDALQKPDHELAKAHARLIKRLGACNFCAQLRVPWSNAALSDFVPVVPAHLQARVSARASSHSSGSRRRRRAFCHSRRTRNGTRTSARRTHC
jgi:hypothetical protein